MRKPYFEIIDDCIDKFRLEDGGTFNFSLLDFSDDVFHNYGRKPPLPTNAVFYLLTHAQNIIDRFGRENPAVKKFADYLAKEIRLFSPPDEMVNAIFEIIFAGKPVSMLSTPTSNHIARFISYLPLKHYWDNSGFIYKKAFEQEQFMGIYLYQYRYDQHHRRPAQVLCREIEIPEEAKHPDILEEKLSAFVEQPFKINAEYFGLESCDDELYDLYGQLFDLLNWGVSNPEGVMNYLDARTEEFSFYNCVFPVVFHGIYYGIAYFDLPAEFFERTRSAAEKLSRILLKGWTYVNHYFPAMILDAYNSRMIGRYTRIKEVTAAEEIIKVVNSKVPFRACYDRQTGALYYLKLAAGEIAKTLESVNLAKALDCASTTFHEWLLAFDPNVHPNQLCTVPQKILGHDLIFLFDLYYLPGKEKCVPILESHLGQAALVLETMKDQREREAYIERTRIFDMIAHDAKTTRELLIGDLEDGIDSDLAAALLQEQSRKEQVLRNFLLRRPNFHGNGQPDQPQKRIILEERFAQLFGKTWRVWLKSRRFRESFRRNARPNLPLSINATKQESECFFREYFQRYPGQPARACIEILRASFCDLSPTASMQVTAPPLLLLEHAESRIDEILYNLLCNYFKHAARSELTGYNECVMRIEAIPTPQSIQFHFVFSNSTSDKERFKEDLRDLWQYKHEMRGLQIIRYLIEADAGETPPQLNLRQENYMWHIEISRECHGCRENALVDSGA